LHNNGLVGFIGLVISFIGLGVSFIGSFVGFVSLSLVSLGGLISDISLIGFISLSLVGFIGLSLVSHNGLSGLPGHVGLCLFGLIKLISLVGHTGLTGLNDFVGRILVGQIDLISVIGFSLIASSASAALLAYRPCDFAAATRRVGPIRCTSPNSFNGVSDLIRRISLVGQNSLISLIGLIGPIGLIDLVGLLDILWMPTTENMEFPRRGHYCYIRHAF
jgi:hypothetical protein